MSQINFKTLPIYLSLGLSFFSGLLYGDKFDTGLHLANTDGETLSMINNVSVITGNYVERQTDLVIPGVEPLSLERFYSSADSSTSCLWRSWRHNHECCLKLIEAAKGNNLTYSAQHINFTGTTTYYNGDINKSEPAITATLDTRLAKGLINCSGEISGRTNTKNQCLLYRPADKEMQIKKGDGSFLNFVIGAQDSNTDKTGTYSVIDYNLSSEKRPSGNIAIYEYDQWRTTKASLKNSSETATLGELFFETSEASAPKIKVSDSCGRAVEYAFETIQFPKQKRIYLSSVTRPEAPIETYKYAINGKQTGALLARKSLPEDRYVEIEYYKPGVNSVGIHKINLKNDDIQVDYVKLLKAPVGVDKTPIITHRFFYAHFRNALGEKVGGFTEVYNALNYKTVYTFTENHRLKGIEKFKGNDGKNYKLHSTEVCMWGSPQSQDMGNLVGRFTKNEKNETVVLRSYLYDKQGNILSEGIYGNLSGKNKAPILVNGNLPVQNGCESYATNYTYSNDGLNLMLSESTDDGLVILYDYWPKTNLLKSKLICNGPEVKIRHFYKYDENAALIREIKDDGSSKDENDLLNVTQRHMTYTQPKMTAPGIGLPEIIEQKYLEVATGEEISQKTTVNAYNNEGRILRQDVYGNEHNLPFSKSWEYDKRGNILKETNEIGGVVLFTYDENNNLLSQNGPNPNYTKFYTYDHANRIIKEIEDDSTNKLSKTYSYDFLGNKITSRDTYGNETQFVYDELGLLIKTVYPPIANDKGVAVLPTTSSQYNVLNQQIAYTDAKGRTTTKTFNIRGQETEIRYPDGTAEKFEYNLNGSLKQSIAKNGMTTKYLYDFLQRPISVEVYSASNVLLEATSHTYDSFPLISTADAIGNVTQYSYDGAGRLNTAP